MDHPLDVLLARYLDLLDESGPDSPEARAFLEAHRDNHLFVQIARPCDRRREDGRK
jgi:hypothetical protein